MNSAIMLSIALLVYGSWAQQSLGGKKNGKPSPALIQVERAQKSIAAQPKSAHAYNELAMALARRARETSDTRFYDEAWRQTQEALKLSPGNFESLKIRAWLLLGKHEFAQALGLAKQLNQQTPDDVFVYGLMADANAELGNYSDAEKAVQWMLDLRPGNVPGLTRAAYLREIFGDLEGAVELMQMAYESTPWNEKEDRAWLLTQLSHLYLEQGKTKSAEKAVLEGLRTFPDYHYALGQLARVRSEQRKYLDAIQLQQRRYAIARHPENLYEFAETLHRAGKTKEAKAVFANFEKAALQQSSTPDNANRELAFYYLDYAHRPADGLRIAKTEFKRRRDVHTLDAYAWALYKNGSFVQAQKIMKQVLATGSRDTNILRHAKLIQKKNALLTGRVSEANEQRHSLKP